MTDSPAEMLRDLRHEQLLKLERRRLLGAGGLGGRSALVAPNRRSRRSLSDRPQPMPEPSTNGGVVLGDGQLLLLSGTAVSIDSGGDYVAFESIDYQHGFTSVAAPGESFVWPHSAVGSVRVNFRWNSYQGGGTIAVEVDGVVPDWGVLAVGAAGQHAIVPRGAHIPAGATVKLKVTQTSGVAQTADVTFELALPERTGLPATLIGGNVVSLGTQAAPASSVWTGQPAGWTDSAAHWIWHTALVSGDRPGGEQAWLQGVVQVTADTAVTLEAAGDDFGELYLNGEQIASLIGLTRVTASFTLFAGLNNFTAHVTNQPPVGPFNPAGFIMSVRNAATSAVLLRTTDAGGWYAATAEPAGWPNP